MSSNALTREKTLNTKSPNKTPLNTTTSTTSNKRYAWLLASILLLFVIMVASLCIGAKPLSIDQLWNVLIGKEHGIAEIIIFEGRLPRTLNGLFVGMALGTSGALIQAITRNPLADPGILGVNLGASLAIAIAIVFWGRLSLLNSSITRRSVLS